MPNLNIKQLEINNNVYDIKDGLSRDAIATLNAIKADKALRVNITRSGTSPNYTYSADKSYEEIVTALGASSGNTDVVLIYDNICYWYYKQGTIRYDYYPDLHFKFTRSDGTSIVNSEFAITVGNAVSFSETTLTPITSHQDISGKADKVSGATSGNFAGLDANGNLTDSGSKASDFQAALVSGTNIKTIDSISLLGSGNIEILPYAGNAITGNIDAVITPGFYKTNGTVGSRGLLVVNSTLSGRSTIITQTRIVNGTAQYRTGELLNNTVSSWSAWSDVIDLSSYAPLASPALTGTPTAPTAASGTNTTQVATTAFVQNALSNMGAGGSEMVDVTITGTTSSASFSTNPYNAIKAVVDDGKIAVLNASVAPLSATGVLIPVYEYTYSQSGTDFTGYKGKIQNGNYEISVDVQSTSSATVTITSVGSSITVDTALSESSTNPVQNRVITAQILENEEIVATALNNLNDRVELKQDQLVSGTTIKIINNQSILGSGNISISGGGGGGGEENVIESITFNGTAVPVDANKNAAITANVPMVVTMTYSGGTYTADKTFAEITSAISNGTLVVLVDSTSTYTLYSVNSSLLRFLHANVDTGNEYVYTTGYSINSSNVITYTSTGIEIVSNVSYDSSSHVITEHYQGGTANVVTAATLVTDGGGYIKPSGGIPATDLASAVQTSLGKADTALQSFTETDPVFTASAAHGITAQDIANWNAKQNSLVNTQNPYTAQGTSTKVPTITTNNLGQVTTITETDIAFPTLSKGSTSGNGNAVTDISVSGHTITLTKGSTFGTYSKPSGGIPSTDLATAVSQRLLPEGNGSTDDGKIVQYSYTGGGWQLVKPITIYTGSTAPSSSTGSNGDIYIQTS